MGCHKLIWGLGIALQLACTLAVAQNYGLDTRQPIGPFLNNKLPSLPPGTAGGWTLVKAFPNLTFQDPVSVRPEPNSNRLYVSGRQGTIHVFENNPQATTKTVFLDIRNRTQGWDDCGLLGLAFHPEFRQPGSPNRGYVYVYYNYSPNPTSGPSRPPQETAGFTRLSRFTVPDGSLSADAGSELVLIQQYDRHLWHNGGAMFFGDDGFLYLSVGDEGGANDNFLSAQKLNGGLFSGILRIDVDMNPDKSHPVRRQPRSGGNNSPASFTANYYIPNDNPFIDPGGSVLEEFWAIGLRSPHSMTIDPVTKRIWLGDVGQGKWEEVNLIERAANYQWPYREGLIEGPKPKPTPLIGAERTPIFSYAHQSGNNCVIGGYVYRGTEHARELRGKYIFGDNGSGRIWSMTYEGGGRPTVTELTRMPTGSSGYIGLSGFGVDQNGELLFCKMGENGTLFKLQRTNPSPPPPSRLSDTGVFSDLASLTPMPGMIPYHVNSPLWSDGALKRRWIAVPGNRKIRFFPTNEWEFPEGTVLVKHFEIPVDENNPTLIRRLETRLLVRTGAEDMYGATYKWRGDHSDADLLQDGETEEITVKTKTGIRKQSWTYPSQTECFVCHNANANLVLGIKTHQLNGSFNYFGQSDNQLRTWNHLGLFDPAINEADIPNLPRAVAVDDSSAPLELRVRSYLDANCASCHRLNGANGYFDARFNTPLDKQDLIDGPLANLLESQNLKVVVPANFNRSVLALRMQSQAGIQMPPLARNVVDQSAVSALRQWINEMPLTSSIILEQPKAVNAIEGESFVLRVVTESTATLRYQWRHDGVAISGATTPVFTRNNAQKSHEGVYSVDVIGSQNSISSEGVPVTVSPKNYFPIVSIINPGERSRLGQAALTIQGNAGSAAGLKEVRVEVSPGNFSAIAEGTTNWSKTVSLTPGTNHIRVVSVNPLGHESIPQERSVVYVVMSAFNVKVTGLGTIVPDLNGQLLENGQNFKLRARPGKGQVFVGWSGGVFSSEPALEFTMQSNLTITATFVPNPFMQWQGNYNGLFYEDEEVKHETSGAFNLRVTSRGSFSGRLLMDGKRVSFSGRFDASGQTRVNTKARGSAGALSVGLQLGSTNQADQIMGQVDNEVWTAALTGDRAILKNRPDAHLIPGHYTLFLSGDNGDESSQWGPEGHGFGTVKIDKSGRVRLTGYLADETRISQSAILSKEQQWPLYIPLYRGKGSLISWVTLSGDTNVVMNEFSWIHKGDPRARLYPSGFTNQATLGGSRFIPSSKGNNLFHLTNSLLVLSGGNLKTNFMLGVVSRGNEIVPQDSDADGTLTIQPTKGLISGSFIHPATKRKILLRGAVLQQEKTIHGYFRDDTSSGAFTIK